MTAEAIVAATDKLKFASFWQRAGAAIIDMLLLGPFVYPVMQLNYSHLANGRAWAILAFPIVSTLLFLWMVVRFGGTPGKMVLGLRIVDSEGEFLSVARAVRRISPDLFWMINFSVMVWLVSQSFIGFAGDPDIIEYAETFKKYGGVSWKINEAQKWYIWLDIGTVPLNRRRRAIHDFLAGSYVVSKDSLSVWREDQMAKQSGVQAAA